MITRLVFLVLCCISPIALAGSTPVKIEGAWMQAVPPVAEATAAYMKITNLGPMITTRTERNGQQIMGMEGVEHLEIPPGGVLELKPGGNHLMVMGLVS